MKKACVRVSGLALFLSSGVAYASGMGAVGLANALLAMAAATACGFLLVCALVAWLGLRLLRGKPRHLARRVLGVLSLLIAVPGALFLIGLPVVGALDVTDHMEYMLDMLRFTLPPLACAVLLGVLGVRLFLADRAAPPTPM